MRKSTRARPEQSQAWKAAMAMARICLDWAAVSLAGMGVARCGGVVLGVVVVELAVGDDLAYDGGDGGFVAEDGHFKLAGFCSGAAYSLFDDELAVEACGEVHGWG